MCSPIAAAYVITTAMTIYAGAETAKSQKEVAQYEAQTAQQNAELNDYRAAQTAAIGSIQEDQHRAKVRQMAGTQRANFAANGIDLGSGVVEDMLDQTYTMGETDALAIRFNAMNEAWGYRTQATNDRNSAAFARYRGDAQARSTWLTTAANVAGSSYQAYQGGVFGSGKSGSVNQRTKTGGNIKGYG